MNYHVLHPFTSMPNDSMDIKDIDQHLMIAESAQGSWFTDTKGNHYYNISNSALGLGSNQIDLIEEAITQYKKLSTGLLIGQGHVKANELAAMLIEIFPKHNMVFYSNDGTGAVETALKIARQHFLMRGESKRKKFISFEGAYHGTTYGSMSVTQMGMDHLYGPILEGCISVPIPKMFRSKKTLEQEIYEKVQALESVIQNEGHETIAAMIIEPIQGVSGIRTLPVEYLHEVRRVTKKYGILLIVDEVTTGIGRLGSWSANEFYHLNGDLITLSKNLTAGYFPLSATLLAPELAEGFVGPNRGFPHGTTLGGHPVGCAIGMQVLKKIRDEDLLNQVNRYGTQIKTELKRNLSNCHCFGEIRGEGLMLGIEFVSDKETLEKPNPEFGGKLQRLLKAEGLITAYSDGVLSFYPPLNVSEIDVEFIISSITKAVKNVE